MNIDERIEFLMQSIESHDRQIGELTDQIGELTKQARNHATEHDRQMRNIMQSIEKLVEVSNQDATSINRLARIADAHENRISDLEDKG